MCLKPDTATILSCTVTYAVGMCRSTLSGWKQHPLLPLCIFSHCIWRTQSFISCKNACWGMQRAPERWEDTPCSPEDHRGESPAELACDSTFSQWTLMKQNKRRVLRSLLPLPQQKPKAFCFECLVETSPYLIPWVYNRSLACTCPKRMRAVLASPNFLFPHDHPSYWLPLHVMIQFVSWFCCSCILKRDFLLHTPVFFYFPHSFNCFLSVVPTPIYPQTLPLSPALAPAQGRPWEWPALNIVVCWEQHGVMWMWPG